MAFLITHFFEGGTAQQYETVLKVVHPEVGLPAGQRYHVAGPTQGGWLIAAVWDSEADFDAFSSEILLPALHDLTGGFAGPPQERSAEVANLVTA